MRTECWKRRYEKLMVLVTTDLSNPIADLHPADRMYACNLEVVYSTQ